MRWLPTSPRSRDRTKSTSRRSIPGLTGAAAAVAFQKDLYADVHGDTLLNNATRSTSVLNFSVSLGGSYDLYGNVSADADYTNVHAYGQNGIPPEWFLQAEISGVTDTPGRPAIVTEAGNYTMPDHTSGVSEDVQAKWMLDTCSTITATASRPPISTNSRMGSPTRQTPSRKTITACSASTGPRSLRQPRSTISRPSSPIAVPPPRPSRPPPSTMR